MSARPGWTAEGRPLVGGAAAGSALVLDAPLSFWGGVDARTGLIVDVHHPQHGVAIAGRVLVMSAGRGSSSSSSVLAEAVRARTGPAAVLLAEPDEIIVLGALVVELLDGLTCPVVVLDGGDHAAIRTGDEVTVQADGQVRVRAQSPRRDLRT